MIPKPVYNCLAKIVILNCKKAVFFFTMFFSSSDRNHMGFLPYKLIILPLNLTISKQNFTKITTEWVVYIIIILEQQHKKKFKLYGNYQIAVLTLREDN